MKNKFYLVILGFFILGTTAQGQIKLKKKAEDKAGKVIDNLLFGKKKKDAGTTNPSAPATDSGNSSSDDDSDLDNYKPQPVDWTGLDMANVIHFSTLIDMLPEEVEGFERSEKPDGAMYSTQGFTYSTGLKKYAKDGRELTISVSDYLGAEYLIGAQTQQYAYESTDGFVKSQEEGEFKGWLSMEYDDNEGSMVMAKSQRFLITINSRGTNEGELKSIFQSLDLANLKAE